MPKILHIDFGLESRACVRIENTPGSTSGGPGTGPPWYYLSRSSSLLCDPQARQLTLRHYSSKGFFLVRPSAKSLQQAGVLA